MRIHVQEIQELWDEFKSGARAKRIDANEIENWVRGLLNKKGVKTFGDLKNLGQPELKLLVQDVNDPTALILPDDAGKLGLQPDELPLVSAVRASIAIPDVPIFAPVRLGTRELAGHSWNKLDVPPTLNKVVLPKTTPLSFYSEPIVGVTTVLRRFLSQGSRKVLDLDKLIAQSSLVREAYSARARKPAPVEVPFDDQPAKELIKKGRLINLKRLPSWFSLSSDALLEAAMNETKHELTGLGIPAGGNMKIYDAAGHETVKNEAEALVPHREAHLEVAENRHINAWIVDGEPPLERGRTYKFAINVGKLCEHANAAPKLRDFDWKDNHELDFWIVLSGYRLIAKPRQQKFTLPKQGDTAPIFFDITPTGDDSVLLRISLYFARELTLLQEFEVPIPVKESVQAA